MNKNRRFFIAFVGVWATLIVWNVLTPPRTFSEEENRNLIQFPKFSMETLIDGRYMSTIDSYLNDQFAGKRYWIAAQSLMEYGIGKRENNRVFIGKDALITHMDDPEMDITKANIEGMQAFADRYSIPSYTMLVPSAAAIEGDKLPTFAVTWDEQTYLQSVQNLFQKPIKPLPLYSVLHERTEEYLYYRTDHHWTSYGAYLAYNQLRAARGEPRVEKDAFSIETVRKDFLGTLHSKSGFPLVKPDTIEKYERGTVQRYEVYDGRETKTYDSIYFDEYLNKKDKYSYFLGPVQPLVTVYTNAPTDRKLLLFKDSYAHCLIPMMLEDYSEIRLIDPRYMNLAVDGDKIEAERYDEVLFVFSTDVFSHQRVTTSLRGL